MQNSNLTSETIHINAPDSPEQERVLTQEAVDFLARLEREFRAQRRQILQQRSIRQEEIDRGAKPSFLKETAHIREDNTWRVAETPPDLQKRRVEITGPTDRKMVINAMNSGASIFMADFEDANSPTWQNMLEGQANLIDAVDGTITFTNPDGKEYFLNEEVAVLLVRPRGWHLPEKHFLVDGSPMSGSLFDFGLYFYHNARRLLEKGSGPYFYLAKLQSHQEARLWNDVFNFAQDHLGIPRGSIRATVLIETILAAFEMEEILYELREHASGLNAGRWDYIFSAIKTFRSTQETIFPDRAQITMISPFMRAYTELLVRTCHKREAHAIGGMAAFIPSRKDPEINEIALTKVREDKERESNDGFDGTWVAHPDLVPVAMETFDRLLGDKPHQKERLRQDVQVTPEQLTDFRVPGEITEEGLRMNISVAILYLEAWLRGTGAVAIYNLMEDTATAEISRAQVWQWLHHDAARLPDGREINAGLYQSLAEEELEKIKNFVGEEAFQGGKFILARQIFDELVLDEGFIEFLTLPAYEYL
jgi:malate synthase